MQLSVDEPVGPDLPDSPTPEERGLYVVLRLEHFIRQGRSSTEGMSFKKWQSMALAEIATNIIDAQNEVTRQDPIINRLLFTAASSLITIGFWGAAISINKVTPLIGALVCGAAGLILLAVACEWSVRKLWRKYETTKRETRFKHVESLNRKIKRLESHLKKEAKDLEQALEDTV